ncbi:MAG: hypothetical protein PHD39_00480 [Methylobacter tundripaludum]|nr:hypothetical protein [Methylobacter tundripaludum]
MLYFGTSGIMLLAIFALFIGISTVAGSEDQRKVVDGVEIYLGVLPVEMVRGHPKEHAESSMHSGLASCAEQYHMLIALFDSNTG